MEKRIDKKYIHKIIKDISYEQIYDSLQKILGEDGKVFAKFLVGYGDYQWEDRTQNWVCIKDLPQSDQGNALRFVKLKLGELEQRIASNKSFERIAPSIVSVPSTEEYIYCSKDSNGDFHMLVTGWGYKYPDRRPTGGFDGGVRVKKQQNVILVFTENDKPVSGVNIILNNNVQKTPTDIQGRFILGQVSVGSSYPVEVRAYDYVSKFTVNNGQEEYIFDMTSYVTAKIIVNKDNTPLSGVLCQLAFNGNCIEVITDGDGVAETKIPYAEGIACKAIVANKSQVKNISGKIDLEYMFSLQSDLTPIVKVEDKDNMIVPNYQVKIQWLENSKTFVSDDNGKIYLPEMPAGTAITCSDNKNRETFEVTLEHIEYIFKVDNDKSIPVDDDAIEDDSIEAHLHVVSDDESLPNYPITLIHNSTRKSYVTDNNGNIALENYVANDNFQALDGNNPSNTCNYTVIDDITEYIFNIPTPEDESVIIDVIETENESWWSKLWIPLLIMLLVFTIGYIVLLNLI